MRRSLLLFFLFLQAFLSADDVVKYKLYCMYTPDYKDMYEQYFLKSLKDDFMVIAREYPQDCPSSVYMEEGWSKTMLNKLELLEEAIVTNWNRQPFFYADVDIIFLRPILQTSLQELGELDFVVQQGWPRNGICAGFFLMRANERTLKLIQEAKRCLVTKQAPDDQVALQKVLDSLSQEEIRWKMLPAEQFPNGRRALNDPGGLYTKDSDLVLDSSILLFHANCCVGLPLKYHFLNRVLASFAQADYVCDVETLPTWRTKQYPLGPHQHIVVFSAPRTGSSLLYNVLRFLFEDDAKLFSHHDAFADVRRVRRTHRVPDLKLLGNEPTLYLFPYRNPLEAAISHFRVNTNKIRNMRAFAYDIVNRQSGSINLSEAFEREGKSVIRLKYEDCLKDFDALFEAIEHAFEITIEPRDKELIRKGYSKENISRCTQNFKTFEEFLPISGFHGEHIAKEKFTPPKKFLVTVLERLQECKPLFQRYGYFQEPLRGLPYDLDTLYGK